MDWDGAKRDWRIWVLALALIVSIGLIVNVTDPVARRNGRRTLNTNIKQGLDLQGGTRILIKPTPEDGDVTDEIVEQIIATLQARISAFGLQETDIRPITINGERYVQVEMAGANMSAVTELLNKTGRFEARLPFTVIDGTRFTLGDETYTAGLGGGMLRIGGEEVDVGESFTLSSGPRDVSFTYINHTARGAVISPLAFSGQDIIGVDIDSKISGLLHMGEDRWMYRFQVSIDRTAAERVRDISQAFYTGSNGTLHDSVTRENVKLVLFLDDALVSSLNISNAFQTSSIQQPVLTGSAETRKEAIAEEREMKTMMRSGALPTPIKIVQTAHISPTLGQQFLRTAILAILVAILMVAGVIFLRYRNPHIVLPLALTGVSELVMIFGFAAAVGWTIDLPSIAGIIAAIGTGVDDQIIITDERNHERMKSRKKRLKRAFFIIFTSAASTIGAMLPLMQIGAGAIKGFAVTTIIGVLIGVLITRPAYARVLQYIEVN